MLHVNACCKRPYQSSFGMQPIVRHCKSQRTWQKIAHESYSSRTSAIKKARMVFPASGNQPQERGRMALQSAFCSIRDRACTQILHLFERSTDRVRRILQGRQRLKSSTSDAV
ncbi:hypothetical protein EVAR_37992_1 [Eumeta japonica]|uniref:Uncharacterized protein n=1 Tax=Eumeta variegata TaxID=151549 RepID=A0A4C1ZXG3_EUMVA|nr:hypothetical protein EVAR_37992_1 [Eumeta japonica]